MNANAAALNAAELYNQANRLAASGEYVAAINRVLQSVAQDQSRAQAWDLLARLQLQFGTYAEAVEAAIAAVRLSPQVADYHYTLGRTLKAMTRVEEAIEEYKAAIQLDATKPHYFCSAGVAFKSLGRIDEAMVSYQAALALDPSNKEAQHNLANALRQVGRTQEAAVTGAQAQSQLSAELDRLVNEAASLHAKGEYKQALMRWTDSLRLAPDSALVHHGHAATLTELHLFEEAQRHEEKALELDPKHADALGGARKLAAFAGDVDKVAHYGQRLLALRPSDDALRITSELALPVVHESQASIIESRERFEKAIDALLSSQLRVANPNETIGNLSFYLAYHGLSNRAIQQKLGQLMIHACPDLTWEAPHCGKYQRSSKRLRVGFASELFKNHSIGKTSSGLIAELDRSRFEVFVLNLPGSARKDDATRQWMRERCDHWMTLEGSLERVRAAVAELQLDVLFYQDIGMTPFSYFLAYSRLAPVQCLSFGHPDTTGIPNLDYFVSNDLYEHADAVEHYTERLFLLQNLPTLAYYYRPNEATAVTGRDAWGLSGADHLYVCAQTLFKLHPDFDDLMAGILERDPKARIVLIDGQYGGWTERLNGRFKKRIGDLSRRITFINRMDSNQYLALLRTADVALDTIHFNGMNSSLEALAMGTPVVTLPKQLQRGRHTQAMYRAMELTDCVARDTQDYIDIAVKIGTDPDYRQHVRRTILERNAVLYENRRVVTEFERFFESALAARAN